MIILADFRNIYEFRRCPSRLQPSDRAGGMACEAAAARTRNFLIQYSALLPETYCSPASAARRSFTTACSLCKICDTFATVANACTGKTSTDTSTCTCNAGYFGSGTSCTPCQICDTYATVTEPCDGTTTTDTSTCTCNAGYSGNGLSCSLDSCDKGYYGGGINCLPCKFCDTNAALSGTCTGETSYDTSSCTCNSGYTGNGQTCSANPCNTGYYGSGVNCVSCQTCDVHAILLRACNGTTSYDTSTCTCNAGYFGTGTSCSICKIRIVLILTK